MCMEDVRLGRKSRPSVSSVAMTNTQKLLVSHSDQRITLIISAPLTNRLTIHTRQGAVSLDGIVLYPGGAPLKLNITNDGSLCCANWYGILDAGTDTIGVAESFLTES